MCRPHNQDESALTFSMAGREVLYVWATQAERAAEAWKFTATPEQLGSLFIRVGAVMKVHEMVDGIQSKEDLVRFIEALAGDLRAHPENWENDSLDRYLTALASWLTDSDGYYRNHGLKPPTSPTWKNVAEMLIAAKMYE